MEFLLLVVSRATQTTAICFLPQATSEALILERLRQLDSLGPEPSRPCWELKRGEGCGYLELGGVVVWDAVSV